jgi:hypothetical protein
MNIFGAANKLNSYSVKIGTSELSKESIMSVETVYKNNDVRVLSTLLIKDLHDFNLLIDWKQTKVAISYIDVFNEEVKETFVILDINEEQNDLYEKFLTINLQDTFSYALETSFLSKSYTSDIVTALNEYITHLEIQEYKELDFTISDKILSFIVPENINNLEWFNNELHKYGYKFYQTKDKICLKSYDDLLVVNLIENDPGKPFLDETINELYKNKIYDSLVDHLTRSSMPAITRGLAYDIDTKKITYQEYNEITDFIINDDSLNIQNTIGKKDLYQTHLNFDQLKSEMKDEFLSINELMIVVNGYKKNDINQIYELRLRGNKSNNESQTKGNMIVGGKWVSQKITDKIIGDSLIQRITLNRVDMVKKS